MTHIDAFDPPMCCSSGVCGPTVDPLLAAFAADVDWLRDPRFTMVLLVTLPEAMPIDEAMQLEHDLARADITPSAWVFNQSLTPLELTDPVLRARRRHEAVHLRELATRVKRTALEPWHADILAGDPVGA